MVLTKRNEKMKDILKFVVFVTIGLLGFFALAYPTTTGSFNDPPIIQPGDGWLGQTAPPGVVGAGRPHDDAKVIARWDTVPYQEIDNEFEVGLVAFHINQIDRVEFAVEGGEWVSHNQMQYNPRTNVYEYYGILRKQDFSTVGPIEVRAIAYPRAGLPRLLPPLKLFVDPDNTTPFKTRWVSTTGDDSNDGSFEHPLASISQAAINISNDFGSADGGRIFLMPGDYAYGGMSYPNTVTMSDKWLTITPHFPATKEDVRITSNLGSMKTKLIHFKDLTFREGVESSVGVPSAIWLDDCHMIGNGPETKINQWGHWLSSHTWTLGDYITDSEAEQNFHGFMHSKGLIRNTSVHDLASDAYQNGVCVINSTAYNLTKGSTDAHVDVYQITYRLPEELGSVENPNPDINCVFYGNVGVDYRGQGIYFGDGPNDADPWMEVEYDNIALVNNYLNALPATARNNLSNHTLRHCLLWNNTFLGQRFDINMDFGDDYLENISIRGNCFMALRYGDAHTPDLLDGHDVFDNHYVDGLGHFHAITPGEGWTEGDPGFYPNWIIPNVSSILNNRMQPLTPSDLMGRERGLSTAVGAFVGRNK